MNLKENEIDNKLKEILSKELLISKKNINPNSSSKNIKNWDSLKHMLIINIIESKFDIYFENEDIVKMNDFVSIKNILLKYLNLRNS